MTQIAAPPRRRRSGAGTAIEAPDLPEPLKEERYQQTASVGSLAFRVREVGQAVRAGNEFETREALRRLAREAALMAMSDPLPLGRGDHRRRIAVERDGSGHQ